MEKIKAWAKKTAWVNKIRAWVNNINAWVNNINVWINLKTHRIKGRSYFAVDDGLALFFILLGVLGFIEDGPLPYVPFLTDFYWGLRSEMIGIGITVLIITNANDWMNRRAEKDRLILQMGSPDNAIAVEAVRQISSRGWLYDGSLRGGYLSGADLKGAKLSEADLKGTQLSGADLKGANLTRATLCEVELFGADLKGANLTRAKLHGAHLFGADLKGANLSGADLSEVKLIVADLKGTDLSGADLKGANLTRVKYDKETIWPDGFDPEATGAILVEEND